MSGEDKELVRHAVLECLVTRHPVALPAAGIARRIRTEVDVEFGAEDVAGALAVLEGLGLVKRQVDELGSSEWWSATAQGVLKQERGNR